VKLAFGHPKVRHAEPSTEWPSARDLGRHDGEAWIVFRKELLDALRDRRTLLMVLLSSVAIGPLVLVLLSALVSAWRSAPRRASWWWQGIEHAPTLRNYFERQTYSCVAAPPDFERSCATASWATRCWSSARLRGRAARGEAPLVELRRAPPTSARRAAARAATCCAASTRSRPRCAGRARRGAGDAGGGRRSRSATWPTPCTRAAQLAGHAALLRADGGALRRAERGAGHHRRRARARLARAAADEPGVARRWCWASGPPWPAWAC
jgi:hypothetical protein